MIGTGYVGLTSGVCFAELGHTVTCLDINKEKIDALQNGECIIFEHDLEELLKKNLAEGRLFFTSDYKKAIPSADCVFFCVDTPLGEYGKANLTNLLAAASECARHLDGYVVLINKSTAPVGTTAKIKEVVAEHAPQAEFDVASNPEFLAEGTAVRDFLQPNRIVIGAESSRAEQILREVYKPLIEQGRTFFATTIPSAELIKYASNAFLAMKLSFINEVADFCELVGADVEDVSHGIGLDSRIGSRFLKASIGFGGSCFGKDVSALVRRGEEEGYEFKMVKALIAVNSVRYLVALNKLIKHLGALKGKTVAVLGLAYKAGTDDTRDSQSLRIIFELLAHGAEVRATDPKAIENFKKMFSRSAEIEYFATALDAARGADVALILTEWDEYKNISLAKLKNTMSGNVLVDGRNILNRKTVETAGFTYEGIGR